MDEKHPTKEQLMDELTELRRRSEDRCRRMLDAMPLLVWTAEADGRIDYINRRRSLFMGLREEPDGTWQWAAAVHPEDAHHTLQEWQSALKTGCLYQFTHRLQCQDGTYRWYLSQAEPERVGGRIVKWFGTATEIHDQKCAQENFRISEERLRLALDAGRMGICDHDLQSGRTTWDCRMQTLLDRSTQDAQMTMQDFFDHVHMEDRPRVRLYLMEALQCGSEFSEEFRIIRKDGRLCWLRGAGRIFCDDTEKPVRLAAIFHDITGRKETEAELRRNKERFLGIIQTVPSLTFEGDAQGNNIFASDRWCEYTGMTAEQSAGMGWTLAVHPDDLPAVTARWSESMHTGTLFSSRHRLRAKDGSYRWFVARSQPIRDAAGVIVRWMGSLTDIDDLMQTEQALRDSREELLRVNTLLEQKVQARTEELIRRNLELKQLTKKTIQVLENERKALSKELHDSIGGTLAAVRYRLEGRIEKMDRPPPGVDITLERLNDFLLGAIQETRRISKRLRPYLLDELGLIAALNDFIGEFKELYSSMTVFQECTLSEEVLNEEVKTVLYRLAQEALHNAGKHSGAHVIAIKLYQQENEVGLEVRDDGCGFTPYSGAEDAKSMRYGIRGMKERVDICHGRIDIQSKPGQGTVIKATIPLS
jgi:PAS domain S-box-containing protein